MIEQPEGPQFTQPFQDIASTALLLTGSPPTLYRLTQPALEAARSQLRDDRSFDVFVDLTCDAPFIRRGPDPEPVRVCPSRADMLHMLAKQPCGVVSVDDADLGCAENDVPDVARVLRQMRRIRALFDGPHTKGSALIGISSTAYEDPGMRLLEEPKLSYVMLLKPGDFNAKDVGKLGWWAPSAVTAEPESEPTGQHTLPSSRDSIRVRAGALELEVGRRVRAFNDGSATRVPLQFRNHSAQPITVYGVELHLEADARTVPAFPFSYGPAYALDARTWEGAGRYLAEEIDRSLPSAPTRAGTDPVDDRPFDPVIVTLPAGATWTRWVEFFPGYNAWGVEPPPTIDASMIIDATGPGRMSLPVLVEVEHSPYEVAAPERSDDKRHAAGI